MLDLKAILRVVLVQGLKDFGYGVESVESIPSTDAKSPNTINVMRSGSQTEDDRTLISLRRMNAPRPSSFYVGNMATPMSSVGGFSVPLIMGEDTVRVSVEAFHDTGGQSLIDKLMLQIPTMFVQNWDAMTFPLEVGGYGLINPTWRGGADASSTTTTGGKIAYTNHFDFVATLPIDAASAYTPSGSIEYISLLPSLDNAANNGTEPYQLSQYD